MYFVVYSDFLYVYTLLCFLSDIEYVLLCECMTDIRLPFRVHPLCGCMTYMYSFVACKEDQLYPDDGQSRCFYHPIWFEEGYSDEDGGSRLIARWRYPLPDDQYMQWWYPTVWRVQMAPIKLYRGAKWGQDADYRGAAVKQLKQGLALQRWQGFDKSICFRIRGLFSAWVYLQLSILTAFGVLQCGWGEQIPAVCQLQLACR